MNNSSDNGFDNDGDNHWDRDKRTQTHTTDWKLVFESLRNDMAQIGDTLHEIAEQVISERISEFPIFIASYDYIPLGRPIPEIDHLSLNWFFSATILEDFVKRGIIQQDKLYQFQRTFDNPMRKACLFVVTQDADARFIFVPYELEEIF